KKDPMASRPACQCTYGGMVKGRVLLRKAVKISCARRAIIDCPSTACSWRASTAAVSVDPPSETISLTTASTAPRGARSEKASPPCAKGACDSVADRATSSVDHCNFALQHHLGLLCSVPRAVTCRSHV